MSESDPINFPRNQARKNAGGGQSSQIETVSFTRIELNQILRVYGFQVAAGEWRDYAIDMMRECAVFSVFRHTSDVPLYRIEKNPQAGTQAGCF